MKQKEKPRRYHASWNIQPTRCYGQNNTDQVFSSCFLYRASFNANLALHAIIPWILRKRCTCHCLFVCGEPYKRTWSHANTIYKLENVRYFICNCAVPISTYVLSRHVNIRKSGMSRDALSLLSNDNQENYRSVSACRSKLKNTESKRCILSCAQSFASWHNRNNYIALQQGCQPAICTFIHI